MSDAINRDEVASIYVEDGDRFVVSLIASYSPTRDSAQTPHMAAEAALDLTRDDNRGGTVWFVYDRHTTVMHKLRQSDFDHAD